MNATIGRHSYFPILKDINLIQAKFLYWMDFQKALTYTKLILNDQTDYSDQSHYIEVAQGDIFMEQKMRFGLVWRRLAIDT